MNTDKTVRIDRSSDDPLSRSLSIFENIALSNLQMTSTIKELLRIRAITETSPSPADVSSFLSPSALYHKKLTPQQSSETSHVPKHAPPSFSTTQTTNALLTSPAENLGFPLQNLSPPQAATGDGEDPHRVASPHQRATTSADQADPSLAAKRSWSTRSKQFNQVSSPPFHPACLKTEAPDYTEYRAVDCSPVHRDKNNDHECVVPTSTEAATPPANRLKDYTPGAATSHQPPSQLPSLKSEAPNYTECIAVGRSPVHLDKNNDHEFLAPTSTETATPPVNRLQDHTPVAASSHQRPSQSPTRVSDSSETMPLLQSSSSDDHTPVGSEDKDKLKKKPKNSPVTASANASQPC